MIIDFNINLLYEKSVFLQDISYDSKNLGADSSLVKQICKHKSGIATGILCGFNEKQLLKVQLFLKIAGKIHGKK